MRRLSCALLAASVLLLGVETPASARRDRRPSVIEEEDGDLLHLHLEGDEAAQAWLWRPSAARAPDAESEERFDLVVALHGAGGNPRNFFMPRLMERRRAYCLAVAGHQAVTHERGEGFMWDGANVEYITRFVEHLVEEHPVQAERVIVWGHSAGGTMTLETLARAPELFAGGLTTAAPRTPSSQHKELRVFVILGTQDANWSGAGSVRSHLESLAKRRSKGACAFLAVEGLGHDVPADDYLDLGFDWILHGAARGGEATVPTRAVGREGPYHHILLRHRDAEGAGEIRRTERSAKSLLKKMLKELRKGRAFFPFEAAVHSEDPATASAGGGIEEDALSALLGEIPALEPDEISDPLPSPQGFHLVWRPRPAGDEEEEDEE